MRINMRAVRTWAAGVLICLALSFVAGCSAKSSSMSWEDFQKALGPEFVKEELVQMPKEDFLKAVGQPSNVTEEGTWVYLTYKLKGGAVVIKVYGLEWNQDPGYAAEGQKPKLTMVRENMVYSGK